MACRTCGGDHRDDACCEGTGSLTRGALLDGRYELFEELGHGGMSRVYRARHAAMDREVAIKVLAAELRRDAVHSQRFLREVRLTGALMHPNIVTVFDAGASESGLYLVMELVRGKPLSAIDRAQLPWQRVVRIAVQICQALDAAHARSIIHRDLKASNVMVVEDGAGGDLVKVVDFGIAAALHDDAEPLTAPNALLGSANAIAPELISSSEALTPRADLYSLGALLHRLLTGAPPFGTGPLEVVVKRQLATEAPPCRGDFPPALGELVGRLLRRDPAERPASARETAELLRAVLELDGPRPPKRTRWWAAVAGVGAMVGLAWALLARDSGRVALPPTAPGLTDGATTTPVRVEAAPSDASVTTSDASSSDAGPVAGVPTVDAGRLVDAGPVAVVPTVDAGPIDGGMKRLKPRPKSVYFE